MTRFGPPRVPPAVTCHLPASRLQLAVLASLHQECSSAQHRDHGPALAACGSSRKRHPLDVLPQQPPSRAHPPPHMPTRSNEEVHLLATMTGRCDRYSIHTTSGRTSVERHNNTTAAKTPDSFRTATLPGQKASKSSPM